MCQTSISSEEPGQHKTSYDAVSANERREIEVVCTVLLSQRRARYDQYMLSFLCVDSDTS